MLLTPLLFILFDRVIARHYARDQREADEIDVKTEIIILGHGRVGGIVNRMLRSAGYVIDYSSSQLEALRKFDLKIFYGDGTRPDLLHAAGIEQARMLVVAIDKKEPATTLVRYVAKNYPHVHIIARAQDRAHVYDLWYAGCRDIIRETYDSSVRMGRSAYEALGRSRAQAEEMAAEYNKRDRQALLEVATLYREGVRFSENPELVQKLKQMLREWEQDLIGSSDENAIDDDEALLRQLND